MGAHGGRGNCRCTRQFVWDWLEYLAILRACRMHSQDEQVYINHELKCSTQFA